MTNEAVDIIRIIDAPIEKVWDAVTNPVSLKFWHSPEGMTNPEVTVDLKVGGKYRIVMEGRNMPNPEYDGIKAVGGEYLEIEKPTKLVYTWLWEGASQETHTTKIVLELKDLGEKTQLHLVHSGFADDNMQNEHDMGWNSTFNKLEKFLV